MSVIDFVAIMPYYIGLTMSDDNEVTSIIITIVITITITIIITTTITIITTITITILTTIITTIIITITIIITVFLIRWSHLIAKAGSKRALLPSLVFPDGL